MSLLQAEAGRMLWKMPFCRNNPGNSHAGGYLLGASVAPLGVNLQTIQPPEICSLMFIRNRQSVEKL